MRWPGAFVLVLAGCFADAPDLADGGSTTGSPACPVGSAGCPCTPGGACDARLECHAPSQLCFDPECIPGSDKCPCSDGQCFTGLACIDDYCQSPPSGETGSSVETTVGETTSSPPESTTTGVVSPTSGPEDGSSTAQSESDPTLATESSTTAPPPTCVECFDAVVYDQCVAHGKACFEDATCFEILTCVLESATPPGLCCEGIGAETVTWNPLVACVQTECAEPCELVPICAV